MMTLPDVYKTQSKGHGSSQSKTQVRCGVALWKDGDDDEVIKLFIIIVLGNRVVFDVDFEEEEESGESCVIGR